MFLASLRSNAIGGWLLVVCAIATASCRTTPQHDFSARDIRPLPGVTAGQIAGIRKAVEEAKTEPVRVLTVHGMLTSNPGFSADWQSNLAKPMGLVRTEPAPPHSIARGYEFEVLTGPTVQSVTTPPSTVQVTRWHVPGDTATRLIFYELVWAPFRDAAKHFFLACFENETPPVGAVCPATTAKKNDDGRVTLNKKLKEGLLVGGLADAALVLSPLADVLRDDLDLTMCLIATDALVAHRKLHDERSQCDPVLAVQRPNNADSSALANDLAATPFFVISHSLGGFFMMDAQVRAAQREPRRHGYLAYELLNGATVFMMANQISLVGLGRLTARCKTADGLPPCRKSISQEAGLFSTTKVEPTMKTDYVAFNDANDMLGYELPPYLPTVFPFGRLVNISARNPARRFPWLKEPTATHTRYHENPAVIKAILDGIPLS